LWFFLALFPASEAVVAVINRLISESARPYHLPRLALTQGIPPAHRVMVVIPGMLNGLDSVDELVHRLHLHYLANPEPQAQFALLTDWVDAAEEHDAPDAGLLARAVAGIHQLNQRHSDMSRLWVRPVSSCCIARAATAAPNNAGWAGSANAASWSSWWLAGRRHGRGVS
jgi:cyclic beta-1,2-glucan synthetase